MKNKKTKATNIRINFAELSWYDFYKLYFFVIFSSVKDFYESKQNPNFF